MPPDLEGLKADPSFLKLPPERQQAMLQHLSGGAGAAPPSGVTGGSALSGIVGGLAGAPESTYEHQVAQPIDETLEKIGLPKWAVENVIPQTKTGLGLDAASMAMPELKAGKVLGDAAGPIAKFVGGRLGRMATMGAVGAGAEAVSGGSPVSGAMQGMGGEAGAQAARGLGGMVTRRMFKGAMLNDTLSKFGASLTKAMPWLGKMQTSEDFGKAMRGDGVNKALAVLRQGKSAVGKAVGGYHFNVPDVNDPTNMVNLPFHEADEMVTKLQRLSHLPVGDPRSGAIAADWHTIAAEARDRLVDQLNNINPKFARVYDKARKTADAAFTVFGHPSLQRGGLFRHDDIFNPNGTLNQPLMVERVNKYANRLERSLGKGNVDNFLSTLRRGATGEVADVPHAGEATGATVHASPTGHVMPRFHLPHSYEAVGQTPKYYEPPHAPVEAATQGIISNMRKQPQQPGTLGPSDMTGRDKSSALGNEVNRMHAEKIAGTNNPTRVARVEHLNRQVVKGKQPNIQSDLRTGRLSMPALKRLLKMQDEKSAPALLKHLGPQDVQHLLALASPEERAWLEPLTRQRLGG
jgi:hypothetical protein